jgi:subtilase family serine protease
VLSERAHACPATQFLATERRDVMGRLKALRLLLLAVAGLTLGWAPQAGAAATPCADLSITGVDVSPGSPIAGTPATISISVHNGGTCAAPGFVVQWKRDQNALTGPSTSVAPLAAGADTTVVVSSRFTYPSPGNYKSVARVDTGNAVSETNENNNLEIRSITVVPATRNLTVTNFTVSPDPVVQGRRATASITVKNTGNSPSGAFRVNWSPFALSTPLSVQTSSLDPGDSRTLTFDYTYTKTGTVDSTARVDSTNTVKETDETDNTSKLRYVVEPPLPDLVVADVSTSPGNPVAGSPTTTTITVRNDGNDPAGDFTVQWRPFAFAQPLTQQVNGLAVGSSKQVTFDYTFGAAGHFDGNVTVDSTNAVSEVSEANNTSPTSLDVSDSTVDLTIVDLCVGPTSTGTCGGTIVQGESATAYIKVKNLGNAPSGRYVTEWNPDTAGIVPQGPHTVSVEAGPLAPGNTRVIALNFTYPKKGDFRTLAHVDAFNAIPETNETNNEKILNLTVAPAPLDLVVDSFSLNPGSPVRGVPATATVVVRNAGPLATGSFAVQFKPRDGALASTQFVNGLNPQETRTLTFKTTYSKTGGYTATATVDPFNTVEEPTGEGNNTATQAVTVVPQSTTLDVTLRSIKVINDGDDSVGQGSDGEWDPILFGVFKPGANCSQDFYGQTISIPSVECVRFSDRDVNDGDSSKNVIDANKTIRVTLNELTPLALAVAASDEDEAPFQGAPFATQFPDVRGAAGLLAFRSKYLTMTSQTIKGQGCVDNGGYCFDATIDVSVVSSNVPHSLRRATLKKATVATASGMPSQAKQAAPARRALKRLRKLAPKLRHIAAHRRHKARH